MAQDKYLEGIVDAYVESDNESASDNSSDDETPKPKLSKKQMKRKREDRKVKEALRDEGDEEEEDVKKQKKEEDNDEDGEVVVDEKPDKRSLPTVSPTGIPFVHALEMDERIILEKARANGRVILMYITPKLTRDEVINHLKRNGLRPSGVYRFTVEPFKNTGNVDILVVLPGKDQVAVAVGTHWRTLSGKAIADCRAWEVPGHVIYIRGFPKSTPDPEIIGFCTKNCGEVLWIKHIDEHELVAIHFAKMRSVHIAKRFEKRNVTYNGLPLYSNFRITTKKQHKKEQTTNDSREYEKLKKIGTVLLRHGMNGGK